MKRISVVASSLPTSLLSAAALCLVAACGNSVPAAGVDPGWREPNGLDGGVGGGGVRDAGGTNDGGAGASALPCEIADLLTKHCASCHGAKPSSGAPVSLLTWADLAKAAPKGGTYASRSVVRMMDVADAMPPAPGAMVSLAEFSAFDAWVKAGIPKGTCNPVVPDAGPPPDDAAASVDAGDGGTLPQTGLPCDVAKVYAPCLSCHGSTPQNGATMPLVSYADITKASPKGGTYATRSLIRMRDMVSPMPPAPNPPTPMADITVLDLWIKANAPMGSCVPVSPDLGMPPIDGGASDAAGTGDAGPIVQSGLPCDVALIYSQCIGCHGTTPSGGATMPLVSYANITAASPKGGTYLTRSITRVQDVLSPMPPQPSPPLTNTEITALKNWSMAGAPMGNCGPVIPDGGIPPDPYATPDVCTTAITWRGGEQDWGKYPKEAMHPGNQCIDCHNNPGKYGLVDNGPDMWIAGTVYKTAHEFLECFGINGNATPASVVITDVNGQVVTLPVGPSGNFFLLKAVGTPAVVFPVRAKVVAGGKTRAMSQTVTTGDCNTCHTLRGTQNAPGRIMAP